MTTETEDTKPEPAAVDNDVPPAAPYVRVPYIPVGLVEYTSDLETALSVTAGVAAGLLIALVLVLRFRELDY